MQLNQLNKYITTNINNKIKICGKINKYKKKINLRCHVIMNLIKKI